MRSGLKHIKFSGRIKDVGRHRTEHDLSVYEDVNLLDGQRGALHLASLYVPTVLAAHLEQACRQGAGRSIALYMLRMQKGELVVAVAYALELDGRKYWYPSQAGKVLQWFALLGSFRAVVARARREPHLALGIAVLPLISWLVSVDASAPLAVSAAAAWLAWLLAPFYQGRTWAAVTEAEAIMDREGFEACRPVAGS